MFKLLAQAGHSSPFYDLMIALQLTGSISGAILAISAPVVLRALHQKGR